MRFSRLVGLIGALSLVLVGSATATPSGERGALRITAITPAPAFTPAEQYEYAGADWITAAGGLKDNRYSTLNQVNTTNVASLKVAWHTHLGFTPGKSESQQGNAVVYKGVMYLPTGLGKVYALDAVTGAILWSYKPTLALAADPLIAANRGLAIGDGKVFVSLLDGSLVALDQQTGTPVWTHLYGPGGVDSGYFTTAPTLYYNGMIIQGISGGDWGSRAYALALDAKTGKELWRWYTVPSPGQAGSGTWPLGDWQKGGGAIWISSSIDPAAGLIYFVTGNPVPYNGRGPGINLFTDSIVALHIEDGTLAWYFQTVHHDIWDYDVTNPPIIFDELIGGVMRKGIATASKTGWVYILDRITGQPLLPIVEKPVKQLPKKDPMRLYANLSATQPFPEGDAFVDQCAHQADYKKLAPDGKPYIIGCIFEPWPTKSRSFYAWTPASAVDWPPSAYNPATHYEYVCATDGPGSSLGAIPVKQQKWIPGDVFSVVGANFGGSKNPSFGNISAMNVTTNKLAWQVRGAAGGWPTPCYSGILTTAGNLVFAAHGQYNENNGLVKKGSGGFITAYNAVTGAKVWDSEELDAGGGAPTITYSVNGKQYITLFAGGAASAKQGDSVYTWALP
jgi:alcohol dehydrogenase (cytochrome c)